MAWYEIVPRTRNGITKHKATVRVSKNGRRVYSESRTFQTPRLAEDWAQRRKIQLDDPSSLDHLAHVDLQIATLIRRYIQEYSVVQGFGRSKLASLEYLEKTALAQRNPLSLKPAHIIDHIRDRRLAGIKASTAANDVIWLRIVFKVARTAWDIPLDMAVIEDAATLLRRERLIGSSDIRDRRPTFGELKRLSWYFRSRDHRADIPMYDIMWFAIFSGRRQSEITVLLHSDNDSRSRTGLVRDLKHPRKKEGNHERFKYTDRGWDIVQRQPRTRGQDRVFPYNPKSISSAFTNACKACGIRGLRFHDLRHEATSRLFEKGYSIVEVQQFTLHKSWEMLKRYTNLRAGDIKLRR